MQFFVLNQTPTDEIGKITYFYPTDYTPLGLAPTCPSCGSFVGMLPLLAPISVELEALGNDWSDIVFGPGDEILVSDRLLELAKEHRLSGFEQTESMTIASAKQQNESIGPPPRFRVLTIPKSDVALDEIASGIVMTDEWTCSDCRSGYIKRVAKVILEPDKSPQHDIFYLRGLPGIILVSDRFKRVCEQNNLTNCLLIPAAEFSLEFHPEERASAGT